MARATPELPTRERPASPTALQTLPPIWVMGLTNATWGLMGGFTVITLPEILAAHGVPGGDIARFVATALWPGTLVAFLSPVLDVRFSRRTYALLAAFLTAAAVIFTVFHQAQTGLIEAVMFAGYMAAGLYQGAVGGWMGSLIPKKDDSRLGAWFAIANTGAGGIMMTLAGPLLHRVSLPLAATCLGLLIVAPTLFFLRIPAPGPDRRLASESFPQFFGEIAALLRQRSVVIALLLFALPSGSFALTNVLGGIGKDFSASERLVSFAAGLGSVFAGIAGSLAIPVLARRLALRPLYLAVGVIGALFTLSLLLLPRTPAVFAIAVTGENIFQAMAFAAGNAIMFEVIGPGNPLAATLFTLLTAVVNLPIIYMGYMDGFGLDRHGILGSFLLDAGLGLLSCASLACMLVFVRRRSFREAATLSS